MRKMAMALVASLCAACAGGQPPSAMPSHSRTAAEERSLDYLHDQAVQEFNARKFGDALRHANDAYSARPSADAAYIVGASFHELYKSLTNSSTQNVATESPSVYQTDAWCWLRKALEPESSTEPLDSEHQEDARQRMNDLAPGGKGPPTLVLSSSRGTIATIVSDESQIKIVEFSSRTTAEVCLLNGHHDLTVHGVRDGKPASAKATFALEYGQLITKDFRAEFPPPKPSLIPSLLSMGMGFGGVILFIGGMIAYDGIEPELDMCTRRPSCLNALDLRRSMEKFHVLRVIGGSVSIAGFVMGTVTLPLYMRDEHRARDTAWMCGVGPLGVLCKGAF